MAEGPQFAAIAGGRVAYQVHGDGDFDIVYSPGLASHLDMTLEHWASGSVTGLLSGEDLILDDRGVHELKGVPEPQALAAVVFA